MLHELHIRNFAIIDDLHVSFGPGLNILTGETGAGKSIIIDAVNLLLGDRATDEWVRAGTDRAEIEATFYLTTENETSEHVKEFLETQGLDDFADPNWLTLGREVRRSGRNVSRVNGRAVSLQILGELTGQLVDVHGQGEHLSLLHPSSHSHLLDRFAGLAKQRDELALLVSRLREVRSELQRLRQDARTMAQRFDLLSFQVEEIDGAALQPGEDVELEGERRRLSNAESLLKLAQSAQTMIDEGESEVPSAIDLLGESVGRIERLARIDPDMDEKAATAQVLLEQMADLARALQDYADTLEFNPERLDEVEERIELIDNLKRKYGDTIAQILVFGADAQAELDDLGNWEAKTSDLEAEEEVRLRVIGELGAKLTAARQAAGESMATQVETQLNELRMERARFGVSIRQTEVDDGCYMPDGRRVSFDRSGVDKIEFLISANPGEPLKPMARVASGGETARLMLALKSVLTAVDATPTLIFDEIDQGIGGRVGAVVGEKLWRLTGQHSRAQDTIEHQVLCITHLPQLAAYGDQHLTVTKRIVTDDGDERTVTQLDVLDETQRIDELTQMLGATSAAGKQSVEEMIVEVAAIKASSTEIQMGTDQ